MDYATIYNEVADLRFNRLAAKVTQIKRWVNAAELKVWNSGNFVFKRVPGANLSVVAGSRTPSMPSDYGKTRVLLDNNGDPLNYLDEESWEETYLGDTSSGRPRDFTVINRQVYLGPTPSASATFKHGYRRRYAHLNNVAAVTAGVMSVDSDTPLWDSEHHYLLVPWAIVLGAALENDVAPERYQAEADRLLAAMQSDLVGGVEAQTLQYG